MRGHLSLLGFSKTKKSFESDYSGPETPALRPVHGSATAISIKVSDGHSNHLWPGPEGYNFRNAVNEVFQNQTHPFYICILGNCQQCLS